MWIEILVVVRTGVVDGVTPFVGVWIEISSSCANSTLSQSLPSWECGLKFLCYCKLPVEYSSLPSWECGLKYLIKPYHNRVCLVTPFVGVWIEIEIWHKKSGSQLVTPFVGVWIEISALIFLGYVL